MADARYMYTAGIPATRVGALIARARTTAGLTDRTLAERLRLRPRVVKEWERGRLVPNDDQIEAIAKVCGVHVAELLPRRKALVYDAAAGVLQLGAAMTTLPMTMRTNDDVLMAFLSLVRQERGLRPDRDVAVRTDDLDALAEALDLDDEELEERLMRVVGLTRRQAAELRAQLLRRRLTAGVVAMIAGIGLVTASRAFATGEVHVSAGDGGRVVRGDPYTRPTAAVTVATTPLLAAPASTTVVASTASTAPATTVTFGPVVTEGSPSTALTTPATLPAVVLAAEVEPVVGQVGRAGPPRTTPRPEVGPPATHSVDPVTTATSPPTTVVLPGPPTLPPPVTTASPPTTAPPAPTAPPTTTTVPTVSTIGGGGTTGTTEAPPPTTTTTTEPPTTTTTEPPTTTTTVAPTTTTTTAPPPTTTTEPPTTLAPPLTPVATP